MLEKRALGLRRGRDRVYYVPNCASLGASELKRKVRQNSQAETRASLGLPPGLMVLYSGHFEAGEDPTFFCEAVAPIAEGNKGFVVFVGEGPELGKVRSFFNRRPEIKVFFFPKLGYEDFLRVLCAADVAAFPYPDNPVHRSKCSARIVDYMFMGKPVLTSAVGANHEYIEDGQSGVLVPANDIEKFSAALRSLLDDSELRARLGSNAENRISENFQWHGAAVDQVLAAYRTTLSDAGVPASSAVAHTSRKSDPYAHDSVSHRIPR